jgi:hypothetical protein
MLRLKDTILTEPPPPDGIDLPPMREPESLEMPTPYTASVDGVTVLTSEQLAEARSAAIPPPPGFELFGYRVSHMTSRFVLSGSSDAYRIWRYRSAEPPIEFPVTEDGWAEAWTTFRKLDNETV